MKIAFGKCKALTVFVEKTSPISGKYGLHRYKYKDSLSNVHLIYKNDQLEKIIHLIWKLNRTFIWKSWNLLHCTKNEVFQKGFFQWIRWKLNIWTVQKIIFCAVSRLSSRIFRREHLEFHIMITQYLVNS